MSTKSLQVMQKDVLRVLCIIFMFTFYNDNCTHVHLQVIQIHVLCVLCIIFMFTFYNDNCTHVHLQVIQIHVLCVLCMFVYTFAMITAHIYIAYCILY